MSLGTRFTSLAARRAMTSPLTVGVFGGFAIILVLAGLPLPAALALGLVAAAARVGLAGSPGATSTSRTERIDPFAVGEPWRVFVREALQAQGRFAQVVRDTPDGPFRDRLDEIGRGVELAVEDCWSISTRAHQLTRVRRLIDTGTLEKRLNSLEGVTDSAGRADDLRASLEAQLASAERVEAAIDDARARLEVLDVRLNEAVTRAAELTTLRDQPGLTSLAADVEGVVDEMEALRRALDELGGTEGTIGA